MRKARIIYSGLAIASRSAAVTCIWTNPKVPRGVGKLPSGRKVGFGCTLIEAMAWGSGIWDWLEAHIWLSLAGPELEAGTKIREAISY